MEKELAKSSENIAKNKETILDTTESIKPEEFDETNEDIKVISSIYFNQELSLKKGNYTKTKPNKFDNNSIKKAKNYFKNINSLDHIQALVVVGEKIIAKEGRQGTKKMLSKVKKNSKGILIKLVRDEGNELKTTEWSKCWYNSLKLNRDFERG